VRLIRSTRHPGLRIAPSEAAAGLRIVAVGDALAGLLGPGERLRAVDGQPLTDVLDFHYYSAFSAEPELSVLGVDGVERQLRVAGERLEGEALEFEPLEFKTCGNDCVFCFIHQMPEGLREDLYIMDEDYRLGFLYGNYVTLALAREHELERIIRQHLSPVYLSVHAIDMPLRNRLLGLKRSRDIRALIERLLAGGVVIHTQVVLVPGWNDGAALDATIEALAGYHPGIESLGIVPVGLSAHRERLMPLRTFDAAGCAAVIAQVETWQRRLGDSIGTRFAHLADEFYLQAGRPLPAMADYEEFYLYDNGIGMSRDFIDTVLAEAERWTRPARPLRVGLLTGKLGEQLLREQLLPALGALPGLSLELRGLENRLFGAGITVSGLLPGEELLAGRALLPAQLDALVLPPNTLNAAGRFLDDLSLEDFRSRAGLPVIVPESGLLGARAEFAKSRS